MIIFSFFNNVSFSCVCPLIDDKFRHNIEKAKTDFQKKERNARLNGRCDCRRI